MKIGLFQVLYAIFLFLCLRHEQSTNFLPLLIGKTVHQTANAAISQNGS